MKRCWLLVAAVLCWSLFAALPFSSYAQTDTDGGVEDVRLSAETLFESLSPAERVGQLFMVTYQGNQIAPDSPITTLITEAHIGGVVLLPQNQNFQPVNGEPLPAHLAESANTLQEIAILGSSPSFITDTVSSGEINEIDPTLQSEELPLFISTSYLDHAYLADGLTEQPDLVAIGATWKLDRAFDAGFIYGAEMNQIGVNLVMDFPLDLLETQEAASLNPNLPNSFGSSPYWVSLMGGAYIDGIHEGSSQRLAVIASRFPGSGSSDRPFGSEIATINKSLAQLEAEDLYPFVQITSREPFTQTVAGLMTAHIRYQGIQGNVNANTLPISLDPNALNSLMQQEELSRWRANGGLLVSEGLGLPSIRRFYNTRGSESPHRQIARDALLAGNDLLYLQNFQDIDNLNAEVDTISDTISWFLTLYETDPSFQNRVDESVLRIIKAKQMLYGDDFSLENVLVPLEEIDTRVGQPQDRMIGIARDAVTQLYPDPIENDDPLPQLSANDQIVIFTDVRVDQACPTCAEKIRLGRTDIEDGILSQYGPNASGQIQQSQLDSFSFTDLIAFLDDDESVPVFSPTATPSPFATPAITSTVEAEGTQTPPDPESTFTPTTTPTPLPTPTPTPIPVKDVIQERLEEASWIVVTMEDLKPQQEETTALKRLLSEQPELIRNKTIVVLAFDLPLYLDSTDISKLTAYYALYSSGEAFEDAAVRLLFRELPIRGALPIHAPALNYNLNEFTLPDPNQVIGLSRSGVENEEGEDLPLQLTPGDTLRLQTGVIVDRNGNQVPDGTIVTFTLLDRVQGFLSVIAEVPTSDGVAMFDYVLEDREGQFRLQAFAGNADRSDNVDIAIEADQEAEIIIVTPTALPTDTPTPAPTATLVPTEPPTVTPAPTSTPSPEPGVEEPQIIITISEFQIFSSMLLGLAGVIFTGSRFRQFSADKRLRMILWGSITGLFGYLYMWYQMPGFDAQSTLSNLGIWRWALMVLVTSIPGMALAIAYNRFRAWLAEEES